MITLDLASTTFLLVAVCGVLCAIQLCYDPKYKVY